MTTASCIFLIIVASCIPTIAGFPGFNPKSRSDLRTAVWGCVTGSSQPTQDGIDVSIQYCGGWGYGPKSHRLKLELEDAFDGEISVKEIKDSGVTGNFEVIVNGDLVWSKRTKGQGFPTSKTQVEGICDVIRDKQLRLRFAQTTNPYRAQLDIRIQYCGGWGYGPKSRKLVKQLEDALDGLFTIKEIKDSGTTGNFEVFVNDDLIWSKRTRNQGFPNTEAQVETIINAIREKEFLLLPITTIPKNGRVLVHIQYCGGWGYDPKSHQLKRQLEGAFKDQISVEEIKDPSVTENFEVFVNGDLVWSKKTRDQGFPTSEAQVETIFAAVRAQQSSDLPMTPHFPFTPRPDKRKRMDIHIQYCGGWGYGPKSRQLKKQLEEAFNGQILVDEIKDSGTTGNFEVVVNGDLIWSKRTRGQGFPTTKAEVEIICDIIREKQEEDG